MRTIVFASNYKHYLEILYKNNMMMVDAGYVSKLDYMRSLNDLIYFGDPYKDSNRVVKRQFDLLWQATDFETTMYYRILNYRLFGGI